MVNVLTPAYPATDSPADQHAADLRRNAFYTDFIMDGAFWVTTPRALSHSSTRFCVPTTPHLRLRTATWRELAKAAPRNGHVRPQLLSVGVYRRLRWRVHQQL